jgi:hypothetical protein
VSSGRGTPDANKIVAGIATQLANSSATAGVSVEAMVEELVKVLRDRGKLDFKSLASKFYDNAGLRIPTPVAPPDLRFPLLSRSQGGALRAAANPSSKTDDGKPLNQRSRPARDKQRKKAP